LKALLAKWLGHPAPKPGRFVDETDPATKLRAAYNRVAQHIAAQKYMVLIDDKIRSASILCASPSSRMARRGSCFIRS
jgi:hypothetical protein